MTDKYIEQSDRPTLELVKDSKILLATDNRPDDLETAFDEVCDIAFDLITQLIESQNRNKQLAEQSEMWRKKYIDAVNWGLSRNGLLQTAGEHD